MEEAGLAQYSNPVERAQVVVRFLSLAGLFRDYCGIVWGEEREPSTDYEYWLEADEELLDRFRVGQLAGRNFTGSYGRALEALADRARREVFPIIHEGFGGDAGLFVSLWRTHQESWTNPYGLAEETGLDARGHEEVAEVPPEDGDEEDDYLETDYDILNDVTPEKVDGYEWVRSGCPPYY